MEKFGIFQLLDTLLALSAQKTEGDEGETAAGQDALRPFCGLETGRGEGLFEGATDGNAPFAAGDRDARESCGAAGDRNTQGGVSAHGTGDSGGCGAPCSVSAAGAAFLPPRYPTGTGAPPAQGRASAPRAREQDEKTGARYTTNGSNLSAHKTETSMAQAKSLSSHKAADGIVQPGDLRDGNGRSGTDGAPPRLPEKGDALAGFLARHDALSKKIDETT